MVKAWASEDTTLCRRPPHQGLLSNRQIPTYPTFTTFKCYCLQLEGYEYPPAIVDAYKSTATAVGAEDISPVYVGVGMVAASGVLLLACRSCQAVPKKKQGRGSKKSKAKAKPTANGSVHKNGGSRKGGAAPAGVAAANGGSGTRGLPSMQPKPPASGAKAAPKPAKKAPAKVPQPQGKGKGKGKPVPEAPPVITVSETDAVCSVGTSWSRLRVLEFAVTTCRWTCKYHRDRLFAYAINATR